MAALGEPPPMGVLEDKARARHFYRYLSRIYDRINPFVWTPAMRDEAVAMLDPTPEDDVLDVGCGTGYATAALLGEVPAVDALDQSRHQLSRATAKFGTDGPVRFARGDAERLPYRDDAFDAVWSSGSIEYWPDPAAALREFRRVLRPGGEVLVVGPTEPAMPGLRQLANAIMLFYDVEEADRLFEAAGLEVVEHRTMGPWYAPEIAIATHARVPSP
jgi:ubiquinone/menaquinone biosynthesis C-methylase UbiE